MNKLIRRFNKSYINSLKNTITTSLLKDTIFLWIDRRKNESGDPMNLSEKLETMCIAYPEVSSDYEVRSYNKQLQANPVFLALIKPRHDLCFLFYSVFQWILVNLMITSLLIYSN